MEITIPARSYHDFQPTSELVQAEDADVLIINLPGFRRDQVKVQADQFEIQVEAQFNKFCILKISGERLMEGNKWIRFRRDFRIPANYNIDAIQATLDNGVLIITMPKIITEIATLVAPPNQQLMVEPKPTPTPQAPPSQKSMTPTPKAPYSQSPNCNSKSDKGKDDDDDDDEKTSVKIRKSGCLVMNVIVAMLVAGMVAVGAYYTIWSPGKSSKQ